MDQPCDADLLRRMAAGDEGAFTTLYRRSQGAVYRFALHMSGRPAVAEDVLQEVFLALMRNPGGYHPERGTLASYLYGMARHAVLRAMRMRPAEPLEEYRAEGDLHEEVSRRQEIGAVRRAVLSLPERYREAVVLCDLEEMDYQAASEVIGCAVGTVRSRLHRGRMLVAAKLRPGRASRVAKVRS
jgi:RNA polymerase sigma-70 factor (ECF subfamily)